MLYSKPFLMVLVVVIMFLALSTYGAYERKEQARVKREELSARLIELEKRAGELESDISRLEDPRGIEMELRSRYEVGKEGEEVIVLIDDEEMKETATKTEEQEEGFWGKIVNVLF